jgi:hypothetical protein
MKKILCLMIKISALFLLILSFTGCSAITSSPDVKASDIKVYNGAMPKGDYVSVTVDMTASTISCHNYTLNENHGPYPFVKVTDPSANFGFNIIYQTAVMPDFSTPNCYARFAIMDGVAIIYQIFNNNGTPANLGDDTTVGYPSYAYFYDANMNLNNDKGKTVNFMNFNMGNGDDNFEVGVGGFDTDSIGTIYSAGFSSLAYTNNWPGYVNGVRKPVGPDYISSFTFDPSRNAFTCFSDNTHTDVFTLIPTSSGDFILDFGANKGAGFCIRQAATKDWQSIYNGDYFTMVYGSSNSNAGQVKPMKLVLSGSGDLQVYDLSSSTPSTAVLNCTFTSFDDWTGGPGGSKLTDLYKTCSLCSNAQAASVKSEYLSHGAFVYDSGTGQTVLLIMDPAGKYCYVAGIQSGTSFQYGYGIKNQ